MTAYCERKVALPTVPLSWCFSRCLPKNSLRPYVVRLASSGTFIPFARHSFEDEEEFSAALGAELSSGRFLLRGIPRGALKPLLRSGIAASFLSCGSEAIVSLPSFAPSASLSELERRALRKVELISTLEDLPPGANGVLHPLMSPLFSPSGGPALRGLFLRAAKRETLSSFALCQGRLCARLLVSRRGAAHYHVELFRRTPTAPLGTIEALLLNVITVLARREALTLSLGEVPFAPEGVTFGVPGNARSSAMRAFERSFSSGGRALLECGYSVQGLYEFKNKFSPHWEPTFWCFPSSSSLPTWWAILRATRIEALLRYGLRRRLKKLS